MYRQNYFKPRKYNNIRQTYQGYNYDSKFEAQVAAELDILQKAGEIKEWERQFKVEIYAWDEYGKPTIRVCSHKVDFRIHHNDKSFELLEAKGIETPDYKWRRKMLELFWLPQNPDHSYSVTKQSSHYLPRKK